MEAFDIYVGLVDLRFAGNHTQWFEVNKVIVHPTYEVYHPVGGDVALVQLKSRIVFSDSVLPVCIASPDVNLHNATCWSTGWGLVSPQGKSTEGQAFCQTCRGPWLCVAIGKRESRRLWGCRCLEPGASTHPAFCMQFHPSYLCCAQRSTDSCCEDPNTQTSKQSFL